ncbi:MAG: coenzyme F420-0:L-glutamate ligase [Candidatus Bathyarchaeota archaeon]|nr:MAG: coenzyme F420-0:L-glutamate ligase [Candidatus Bathyarchaeota archaeon]
MVGVYKRLAAKTCYWKPGEDYFRQIAKSIEREVRNGDFVTVSEKAISTALGNLVDESVVHPGWTARFLAKYWMHYVWGYLLGLLCHLRVKTVQHLRAYPMKEGTVHKQVVLEHAGLLQALMMGSEGGIDGSNLPYSYVSLPLKNPQQTAQKIREHIKSVLDKKVVVIIVDTDKTYSFRTFHFTPRPRPINGIHSFGGFLAYIIGRFFKMKRRATPIAVAGSIPVEEALRIAEIANRAQGFGAGRTIWDTAETFRVPMTGVTWKILDKVKHKPIVIVRVSGVSKLYKKNDLNTKC